MKFQPKTERELVEENLLPKGVYDCEIARALDKVSKNSNEMIELSLQIFTDEGRTFFVTDYLLESMGLKLYRAAEAFGLLDKYDAGMLIADDFIGRTGKCKVGIQSDKSGRYPDKNVIIDYLKPQAAGVGTLGAPAPAPAKLDDEIPF